MVCEREREPGQRQWRCELPLSHLGFSDNGVPVATVRLGSEGVSIALMPSPPVVRDVSPRLSTSVLI